MQTIINWTKSPVVVADEDGKRITIPAGQGRPVKGDFSNHPWVKKRRLEVSQSSDESLDAVEGDDQELDELRTVFYNIFGKKAHKNAKAETLRQKIDEWREGQE